MKHPYDSVFHPPFPVLQASLVNEEEGLRLGVERAYLDTGADGTLVPISYLRQMLAPILHDATIRSHWGERRSVQVFLTDIEVDGVRLPGMLVIGDEVGSDVILGRNVLNRLRLLLDGPALRTEILA